MKRIYIILTYSGTVLSRIVKAYTGAEYSHVSIGLDENLTKMYSFGRLNPYNPFIGGFVHEGINIGTFKRFKNTQTAVYSIMISDEQYNRLNQIVHKVEATSQEYKFNFIGLVAVALHMKIQRRRAFYCAEFVKYAMKKAQIKNNLPDIVKPEDFLNLENIRLEYKGALKQYKVEELPTLNVANLCQICNYKFEIAVIMHDKRNVIK